MVGAPQSGEPDDQAIHASTPKRDDLAGHLQLADGACDRGPVPPKLAGKVTLVYPDDATAPPWGGLEKVS